MKVEWTKDAVPVGCEHEVPSRMAWRVMLAVSGAGLGLWSGFVLAPSQPHAQILLPIGALALLVGGYGLAQCLWQSRRQLYKDSMDHLIELNHLVERAREQHIELEPLPMRTPGQMTNAELKRWARKANQQLLDNALRRVGRSLRDHEPTAQSE